MKEDKISKEIMEKLFHHIDLLKQELCSLKEKDFPFKDTNWFYEKTVVLARIIGRGPELPANDDIEIMRLLQGPIDYTSRVKKGYDRYEIWFDSLKYEVSLIAELSPKELAKIKRKFELEGGVPGLIKAKWSAQDK